MNLALLVSRAKLAGILIAISGTGFSISLASIGVGIYAGALLVEILLGRAERIEFPHPELCLAFLTFLAIAFAVNHDYPWVSFRGVVKYLQGFALLYGVIDVGRTRERFRLMAGFLLLVYFAAAFSGVWQNFAGYDPFYHRPPYVNDGQSRLIGPFKHYNDYGTFIMTGVVVSLGFLLNSFSRKNIPAALFGAALLGMTLFALLGTLSRSAFLSAVAGSIIIISFLPKRRYALIAAALCVAGLIWSQPHLLSRIRELFTMGGSMNERLLLADVSLKMIRQSPIVGLGINTYAVRFPEFRPADYPGLMYAHNSFLQIGVEIGLAGLGLYLLYIALPLKKAWNARGILFAAAVAGLLINACFESLLQSTQLRSLFWVLLGFAVTATSFSHDPNTPAPSPDRPLQRKPR